MLKRIGGLIIIIFTITQTAIASDSLTVKKLNLVGHTWGFVVFKTQKKISNPDKELLKLIKLSFKSESYSKFQSQIEHWAFKKLALRNKSKL
jgi:hypothetical protein